FTHALRAGRRVGLCQMIRGTKSYLPGLFDLKEIKNMGDQSFEASDPGAAPGSQKTRKSQAPDYAFSKASDMARDAGARAKRAASDTASTMTDSVVGLLNEQIGSGATSAGRLADAMRVPGGCRSQEKQHHGQTASVHPP